MRLRAAAVPVGADEAEACKDSGNRWAWLKLESGWKSP